MVCALTMHGANDDAIKTKRSKRCIMRRMIVAHQARRCITSSEPRIRRSQGCDAVSEFLPPVPPVLGRTISVRNHTRGSSGLARVARPELVRRIEIGAIIHADAEAVD